MQRINSETNLKDEILMLENRQAHEALLLKQEFQEAYESVKPINLIKNTFAQAVTSPELKDNILKVSVGMAAGYLTKMLFVSVSKNPFKKLIGTALLVGITNVVARNPETIKAVGLGVLKMLRRR